MPGAQSRGQWGGTRIRQRPPRCSSLCPPGDVRRGCLLPHVPLLRMCVQAPGPSCPLGFCRGSGWEGEQGGSLASPGKAEPPQGGAPFLGGTELLWGLWWPGAPGSLRLGSQAVLLPVPRPEQPSPARPARPGPARPQARRKEESMERLGRGHPGRVLVSVPPSEPGDVILSPSSISGRRGDPSGGWGTRGKGTSKQGSITVREQLPRPPGPEVGARDPACQPDPRVLGGSRCWPWWSRGPWGGLGGSCRGRWVWRLAQSHF